MQRLFTIFTACRVADDKRDKYELCELAINY